jgi:xylan 1,4-beta-xylosidase
MAEAHFRTDWTARPAPLTHFWEHTVGSCHAPLALRTDWQSQLARCRDELGFRNVRFHGLLCDDLGTHVVHGGRTIDSLFLTRTPSSITCSRSACARSWN